MKRSLFLLLLLSGACSSLRQIDGFDAATLDTQDFTLASWSRVSERGKLLRIYIEGDGSAWLNPSTPSDDPTPKTDTVLNLAQADPFPNVVYLARPCQYVRSKSCNVGYWTTGRFAPEIIKAQEEAVRRLMKKYNASGVELVGYSGGGTVAALLAVRMPEVKRFITVAGVLDHRAWTKKHGDTPLEDSLNPADFKQKLEKIPQIHFIGAADKNVPSELTETFVASYANKSNVQTVIVPNASHNRGWVEKWRRLID